MRKGHTAKQEKEIEGLTQTFKGYRLTEFWDFVRLRDPITFPYAHKSRLNNNATTDILQSLKDFIQIFSHLEDSYKYKILSSNELTGFLNEIFRNAKVVEKKQEMEKPEKLFSVSLYNKFLILAIDGLISSMPEEFRIYLRKEIKPFLELMISIGKFGQRIDPKIKTPTVYLPSTFEERSFGQDLTFGNS